MKSQKPNSKYLAQLAATTLHEDLGSVGDVTAMATIPANATSTAKIIAKESGVLAGVQLAVVVLRKMDPKATVRMLKRDGAAIKKGDVVLVMRGRTRALLSAERTALN